MSWRSHNFAQLQTINLINIYDFQRLFLSLETSQRLACKVENHIAISSCFPLHLFDLVEHIGNRLSTKQQVQRSNIYEASTTPSTLQHISYQLLGIPNRRCFTKKSCESIICTNGNTAFARWQKGDQFLLETSKLQFLTPEWIVKPKPNHVTISYISYVIIYLYVLSHKSNIYIRPSVVSEETYPIITCQDTNLLNTPWN